MSAHTPGPWLLNPFVARVDNGFDSPICELLWPTDLRSEDETEANGHLISAAPALLDALRAMLAAVDSWPLSGTHECINARAAIAKAEGA